MKGKEGQVTELKREETQDEGKEDKEKNCDQLKRSRGNERVADENKRKDTRRIEHKQEQQ